MLLIPIAFNSSARLAPIPLTFANSCGASGADSCSFVSGGAIGFGLSSTVWIAVTGAGGGVGDGVCVRICVLGGFGLNVKPRLTNNIPSIAVATIHVVLSPAPLIMVYDAAVMRKNIRPIM